MERFSDENIDKLVLAPTMGIVDNIRVLGGRVIDLAGFFGAIGIILMVFIFNLPGHLLIFVPVFIIFQFILFYFTHIKFNQIKVIEYKIDLGIGKEAQFVFVSDIHMGSEYASTDLKRTHKIIELINNLKPEVVLLGGDYLTHKLEPHFIEELKHINAPTRLAVLGNHDAQYLEDKITRNLPVEFLNAFKKTNIDMLINESKLININGVDITVAGIPDLYSKNFNIVKAFEGAKKDTVKILLAHNPDVIDFIDESDNIDLILSGHNHSGQIFLMGKAILPMPTKRKWLTKGVFNINRKTKLFLSQGVGYSGSRLRINTDSEVCLITIY